MSHSFELLGSASFLVDDHRHSAAALQRAVGVPPPKAHWVLDTPGRGIVATFLRPAPSVVVCPTPIELVSIAALHRDADPRSGLAILPAVSRSQGDRPTKVHATDIAVADIDGIIDSCRRARRRHWVHEDPHGVRRVWIGFDAGSNSTYRSDGDAGLHFEFLPTDALKLPASVFETVTLPPLEDRGALLGLAWRTYLVSDLDAVLREVADAFGWEPPEPVELGVDGSRRARLCFAISSSPALELIEPAGLTAEADAIGRWGPGAWSLALRVDGLAGAADDLRKRGTSFRELRSVFGAQSPFLRVDPAHTPGCLLDLVDVRDAPL